MAAGGHLPALARSPARSVVLKQQTASLLPLMRLLLLCQPASAAVQAVQAMQASQYRCGSRKACPPDRRGAQATRTHGHADSGRPPAQSHLSVPC
ncbi:hypothetical protein BC831DRAFT_444427 [Entophlyctis helioformis]|nr:hypothetical protein BC831DRAFT_444427 [Entophlyctis helioformis]